MPESLMDHPDIPSVEDSGRLYHPMPELVRALLQVGVKKTSNFVKVECCFRSVRGYMVLCM